MKAMSMTTLLSLFLGLNAGAEPPVAIAGDYVEARSNEIYTCGCIFSGEQLLSGREAILAWDIKEGAFNGVKLAGTKVVAVIAGQGNLDMQENSRRSILYVDTRDSDAQQGVLNLFSRRYGKVLGEILAVRSVPISFRMDGDKATVKLADTSLALRKAVLPKDAHPGSSLWYSPFVPMTEKELAARLSYEFSGEGFRHQWRVTYPPYITGYVGKFVLDAN